MDEPHIAEACALSILDASLDSSGNTAPLLWSSSSLGGSGSDAESTSITGRCGRLSSTSTLSSSTADCASGPFMKPAWAVSGDASAVPEFRPRGLVQPNGNNDPVGLEESDSLHPAPGSLAAHIANIADALATLHMDERQRRHTAGGCPSSTGTDTSSSSASPDDTPTMAVIQRDAAVIACKRTVRGRRPADVQCNSNANELLMSSVADPVRHSSSYSPPLALGPPTPPLPPLPPPASSLISRPFGQWPTSWQQVAMMVAAASPGGMQQHSPMSAGGMYYGRSGDKTMHDDPYGYAGIDRHLYPTLVPRTYNGRSKMRHSPARFF